MPRFDLLPSISRPMTAFDFPSRRCSLLYERIINSSFRIKDQYSVVPFMGFCPGRPIVLNPVFVSYLRKFNLLLDLLNHSVSIKHCSVSQRPLFSKSDFEKVLFSIRGSLNIVIQSGFFQDNKMLLDLGLFFENILELLSILFYDYNGVLDEIKKIGQIIVKMINY